MNVRTRTRVAIGLLATAGVLTLWAEGSQPKLKLRAPLEAPGPAKALEEDDPNWDCRTMGNHICGSTIYFHLGNEWIGWPLDSTERPSCWMEPSSTPEGYEVILYDHLRLVPPNEVGFEIPCP